MQVRLKKLSLKEAAPIVFRIYNAAFTRPFDSKVEDVKFVKDYLAKSIIFVGYIKDIPISYFAYEFQGEERVELRSTGVLPEYQNMGVGRMMLKYFLNLFPDKKIFLITHPKNVFAIILYLKHGFMITGWKENYYGDGEPRLILNRDTN